MSTRQRNSVLFGAADVAWYCGYDIRDKLLNLIQMELDPYDASAIVSCVMDFQKDEREGVSETRKKQVAEELKTIIHKYL